MSTIVEGDWKDFTFKMARKEHYPEIFQHLRSSFYLDEPINRHLGQGELKTKDMDMFAMMFLEQEISFFAVHKPSGKVAGVRITGIARKGSNDIEEAISMLESEECKNLVSNYLEMMAEGNIYERMGIDAYGDFLFVSVDKEFRGQGLASEMYKRAILLLQSKGITVAESVFTNEYSQRIAKKLGFVELTRKYLKEYMRQDGRRLLPEAGDDEVGILMAKKF